MRTDTKRRAVQLLELATPWKESLSERILRELTCTVVPSQPEKIHAHSFVYPSFFCILFAFLCPCPPQPFPIQFSSPKSCLSGTSDLLSLVEKREPPGAGFWGPFWTGSPHRKKRKSFVSVARKKVSLGPELRIQYTCTYVNNSEHHRF